jgi:hypothetical protein
MRRLLVRTFSWVLMSVAAVLLSRYWYTHPDHFPVPLRVAGNGLVDWLGVESADTSADVELIYVVGVAFLIVFTSARLFCFVWRRLRTQHE